MRLASQIFSVLNNHVVLIPKTASQYRMKFQVNSNTWNLYDDIGMVPCSTACQPAQLSYRHFKHITILVSSHRNILRQPG